MSIAVQKRWGARHIEPELMDGVDPAVAQHCLRDLVRINSKFGGHAIMKSLLERSVRNTRPFSLLDVGAASGDTAQLIRREYPQAKVVSLDRNAVNLSAAKDPKVLADAFGLPFRDKSFDFVASSLFLHHFQDDQIVSLLRSFGQIAKKAVLVSDLERHPIPYFFLSASRFIFKWHWLSVYDGKISVRAALTSNELYGLAKDAGLRDIEVATHRPAFRISLIGRP